MVKKNSKALKVVTMLQTMIVFSTEQEDKKFLKSFFKNIFNDFIYLYF